MEIDIIIVTLAIMLNYLLVNAVGTGDMGLLALTGNYDGVQKRGILNYHIFAITSLFHKREDRIYGAIAMSLRGNYCSFGAMLLAVYFNDASFISVGMVGLVSGLNYYSVGSIYKGRYNAAIAEYLDGITIWATQIIIYPLLAWA